MIISSQRDLVSYSHLIQDLSYIIPTPLLESFLSLRAVYNNFALAITQQNDPFSKSKMWGAACDRALNLYNIHQLRAIKEYVCLTKYAMHTARECLDDKPQYDPRLTVPLTVEIPSGLSTNQTLRNAFVRNTRSRLHTTFTQKSGKFRGNKNLAFDDPDEFPSLVPSSSSRPPALPSKYSPPRKAPVLVYQGVKVTYCSVCGRRNSVNSCGCLNMSKNLPNDS